MQKSLMHFFQDSFLYETHRLLTNIGIELLKIQKLGSYTVAYKSENSPVTEADILSHDILIQFLRSYSIPAISEEGSLYTKNKKTFWLIDPLDGTHAFIENNQNFSIHLALIHNKTPILGITHLPKTQESFIGDPRNKRGFILQHETLTELLTFSLLPKELIALGKRSHIQASLQHYPQFFIKEHFFQPSGLKYCLIAKRKAHIYPRFAPTMEWDTASGHALLKALGGEIYNLNAPIPTPLRYGKTEFKNPSIMALAQTYDFS